MLLTFTKTPSYYHGSNIIYRDPEPLPIYDNIVRLYEVIFYDIYNTFLQLELKNFLV